MKYWHSIVTWWFWSHEFLRLLPALPGLRSKNDKLGQPAASIYKSHRGVSTRVIEVDLKILLQFVKIATRCPCCFYDLSQHNQQASITLLFNTDGIIEKVARWSGVPWLCEPSRKAPLHSALRQLQILIQVQYPDSQIFNRKFVKQPHSFQASSSGCHPASSTWESTCFPQLVLGHLATSTACCGDTRVSSSLQLDGLNCQLTSVGFGRGGCDKFPHMDQEESEWFNHVQSLDYMRLHVVFLQQVRWI